MIHVRKEIDRLERRIKEDRELRIITRRKHERQLKKMRNLYTKEFEHANRLLQQLQAAKTALDERNVTLSKWQAENTQLRQERDDKQETIESWKEWHQKLRDKLGVKFNERNVTLEAIDTLRAELERLKDLYHDHDAEDKANNCKDCPMCYLEARVQERRTARP